MQVKYHQKFDRDISKIRQQSVADEVAKQITEVKKCKTFIDFVRLPNVTKLVGHDDFYRIKFGDYRIGVKVVDNFVCFSRFGTRSKIYKIFP